MMKTMNDRANEMINNWTPETASLIATLKRHGFTIVKGHNGEEGFKLEEGRDGMKKFIANLIACDEAHLYVKGPGSDKLRWLYLVLGNSPGEIVSDFSIPSEVNMNDDALDRATSEHYNRWEGRKQPKQTNAQAYPEVYGPEALAKREGGAK